MSYPLVPRAVERWLQVVLRPHRASTLLGDLEEELAARQDSGRPIRFVRLWWLGHAIALTVTAVITGATRSLRAARQICRDAYRGLRASPGVTMIGAAILTAGIAAATVTFSVVDHVVLRHLSFPDDDRLVQISGRSPTWAVNLVAPQDYFAWREGVDALASAAAWRPGLAEIRMGDHVEAVPAVIASASLFGVLQIAPLIGSPFGPEHETEGSSRVVLIGESLWRARFAAAPDIVGQMLIVEGEPYRVLGVVAQGFEFPPGARQPTQLWIPYVWRAGDRTYVDAVGRGGNLLVTGRLRPDATVEQARAQVEAVTAAMTAAYPEFYRDWRSVTLPLREAIVGPARGWMLLVLWAVVLLVLLGCVNVANLLLARSAVRMRDFAVRAALGATRGQLVSSLLVESLMLSAIAALAAVLIAAWSLDVIKAALPAGLSRVTNISIDARVLATMIAAAIVTGLTFGIVPAWQASRADVTEILKMGGTTVAVSRRRWRSGLLVAEMAVVTVLLVTSSLLVASFVRIMRADLGFDRTNLVSVSPRLPLANIPPAERTARRRAFFRDAVEALRQKPGVTHVALMAGGGLPLSGNRSSTRLSLPDTQDSASPLSAEQRRVSAEYFETAGIRILEGRTFGPGDEAAAMIIDELAARRLFGDASAVGRRIRLPGGGERVVVGVAVNVRLTGPEGDLLAQAYYPWSTDVGGQSGEPLLVVRGSPDASELVPVIQAALKPLLPVGAAQPSVTDVADQYRRLTADRRFNAGLMSVFGALALIIGAAGIYGVMAAMVAQQTREIGIRTALGATRRRIASLVLSEAARHVALGLAIGLAMAWAVSGIFSSLVFGITPTEPALYLVVAAVVGLVALLAAWIPARRASRVDPIIALRE